MSSQESLVLKLIKHGFVHKVGVQAFHFGLPSILLQPSLSGGCRMRGEAKFKIPVFVNNKATIAAQGSLMAACSYLGILRRWYSLKNR